MLAPQPAVPGQSAEALLDAMSEAVYAVDRSGTITYWNAAAERLTGYQATEVVGRRCSANILNHVDDAGTHLCRTGCPLRATMGDGETREVQVYLHHHDGHRVPVDIRAGALRSEDGAVTGAVEVFCDDSRFRALTDRLDVVQAEALSDPLTGIENRRMLERVLDLRHEEFERYHRNYAVVFADVDHFKLVNDHYGHGVGDRMLQLVAATLRDSTRPSDTAGRWGGEEFLLVAPVADEGQAVALAERMRHLVAETWTEHERNRVNVTLSIGVAVARPGERTEDLVNRAGTAMQTAKRAGRNRTLVG